MLSLLQAGTRAMFQTPAHCRVIDACFKQFVMHTAFAEERMKAKQMDAEAFLC